MFESFRNIRLHLFLKSSLYNLIFNEKLNDKILHNPESLWRGNKKNGIKIIEGFLNYQKETVYFDNKVWKSNHGSSYWNNYLHSFMWIKDIRAVGSDQARIFVRQKIISWIEENNHSKEIVWSNGVLSKRIFYLLTNLSFFFETADQIFQRKFAINLNKQCILLFKNYKRTRGIKENIFVIKSMILSSLCFQNLKDNYDSSIERLKTNIDKTLFDGMHYLRSPSDHFYFLCSLLDIKNFIGSLNKDIPFGLNQIIEDMSSILNFFRIGDGHLAIFNNYEFIEKNKINNVLRKVGNKYRLPKVSECFGFRRISKNKLIFIMDCGSPTKERTQAGSLSFEFSHFSEKIVVNCGSAFINNKDWNDAMRSTAAHSTLNINEINSSDIFFNKDTTTRIAKVSSDKFEDDDNVWIKSSHEGYQELFGIIHKRIIHIDLINLIIRGEDSFELKENKLLKNRSKYFLRFHIHPSIKLNVTASRKKVVLKLKNNGWEFISSDPIVEIEDGIYLGENKIVQPNHHILLKDNIEEGKKIKWLFRLIK